MNKLCVENLSGTSRAAVLQDFYATIFLWNLTGMLAFELKDDIKAQHCSEKKERLSVKHQHSNFLSERACGQTCYVRKINEKPNVSFAKHRKVLRKSVVAASTDRSFLRKQNRSVFKIYNNVKTA